MLIGSEEQIGQTLSGSDDAARLNEMRNKHIERSTQIELVVTGQTENGGQRNS
jgi:hypothetical protein